MPGTGAWCLVWLGGKKFMAMDFLPVAVGIWRRDFILCYSGFSKDKFTF